MAPEICPTCGADVPEGARACPECGADEKTGWSETARYENLGIPDDSFDYGEYIKRELKVQAGARELVCLVYEIHPKRIVGRPVIPSGDWLAHMRSIS